MHYCHHEGLASTSTSIMKKRLSFNPMRLLAALTIASTAGCLIPEPDPAEQAPGYVIVQIDAISDPDTFFTDYAQMAGPTLVEHGFVGMVASAEPNRLEGEAPDAWTVVIQFPSVEAAQAWYDDPDYVAARPFRINSVRQTDMILMRGLPGTGQDLSGYGAYLLEQSEVVLEADAFDDYLDDSAESLANVGAEVLLEGQPEVLLEGDWPDASTRLVGFPSTDAVTTWYWSGEYAELKAERIEVTEGPSLAGFETFALP